MTGRRPVLAALLLCGAVLAAGGPRNVFGEAGGAASEDPGGFRLVEATAAAVNGEVLFLSDLDRRACLLRCGAFPGEEPEDLPADEVRDRLIRETLVLQEEAKLGLGELDNNALNEAAAEAVSRVAACGAPCAARTSREDVRSFVRRRMLVREFLRMRVSVFVDVTDEEVRREIQRRASREGVAPESLSEGAVRREIFEEKTAREIRNWLDRVTSKSRIVRSPLEER